MTDSGHGLRRGAMLVCLLLASQAAAAEGLRFAFESASRFGAADASYVMSMRGEIEEGDADRFLQFLRDNREQFVAEGERVVLVIDGGDVEEALRLGERLRDALVAAWLPDASRSRCVSACFFLLAHCVSRHAVPDAVGLPRPYFSARALASASPEAVRRRYQSLESELRERMTELTVPVHLIETLQKLPAGEVYRLTQHDLDRLGASQGWFEDYLAARCGEGSTDTNAACREAVLREHRRQYSEKLQSDGH
jgi:hypothetical protein